MKGEIITNIEFTVSGQRISVQKDSRIIADSVGFVTFTCSFDSQWDGLIKYAVFTNGDISRTVAVMSGEQFFIPHEALKKGRLYASFVGISSDGEKKLTTGKMLFPLIVLEAGAQEGTDAQAYTPTLTEQVLSLIGDTGSLATEAKSDLVSAVNELAAALSGQQGQSGSSPAMTAEQVNTLIEAYIESLDADGIGY